MMDTNLILTKIMAFILLLIWGALTMLIIFSMFGAFVLCLMDYDDDWICGGKQLLEKVLKT